LPDIRQWRTLEAFTLVESEAFARLRPVYLDDDEFAALQWLLVRSPGAGPLVAGSGGVRKLRWGTLNRGKRGGLRVIYHVNTERKEIWLLTLYAKAKHDSIPAHLLRQILEAFRGD
jgi:mRNA-degrading endonuclease RelE of RelBE toxin-antitoxin system